MKRMIGALVLSAVALADLANAGDDLIQRPIPAESITMGPPYPSGSVLPAPRHAEYGDSAVLLIDGPGKQWACHVVVDCPDPAGQLVERLLRRRLESYAQQFAELEPWPSSKQGVPVRFELKPGRQRRGSPTAKDEAALQRYELTIDKKGVHCRASGPAGLVFGAASFLQLLEVRDGRLVARHAQVRDWPVFLYRFTSEYHFPAEDFFDWMMMYKINGFGVSYRAMRWEGLDDTMRAGLRRVGSYQEYGTLTFMAQFHVGGRGRDSGVLDCANPAHVEQFLNTLEETFRLAAPRHVMVCYDDVRPELQPMEQGRFERPAQAHGALMARVYEKVKALNPATPVSFCSPYYQGRQHRKWRMDNPDLDMMHAYLKDMRNWDAKDVQIVWTGPLTESRSITRKDIAHYQFHSGREKLVYWDNTWHYHQPLRNFHAKYLDDFIDYCVDNTSYINVNGTIPIGQFFAATATDYYWNPDAFDPERAWRHAVAQFMGPGAVPAAEAFYALRGEDYFVNFRKAVDLEALKAVFSDIEHTSLDTGITKYCWDVYDGIVKERETAAK